MNLKGVDDESFATGWADIERVLVNDLQSKVIQDRQGRRQKQVLALVNPQSSGILGPVFLAPKNTECEVLRLPGS